jgi:hypothetical protein
MSSLIGHPTPPASSIFSVALLLASLLLFAWPIPGTIALRHGLAGLLLLTTLIGYWRECRQPLSGVQSLLAPVIIFASLSAWIFLVIAGWAAEPGLSWKEFWAQWTLPALCGLTGFLLARMSVVMGQAGIQRVLKVIFFTLFLQVLLHNVLDAAYLFATGTQPFRQAPVLYLPLFIKTWQAGGEWTQTFIGQYFEKFSFVNNTFAAILIAELLQRAIEKRRWLDLPNWLLGLSFVLVLLCSYWLRVRNGNLGLVFLLLMAGLMTLIRIRHRFKPRSLALVLCSGLLLFGGIATAFWKSDARWQTFAETVPIALDTSSHKAWLSTRVEPYPRLANGNQVDPSNYERIAWIKEGFKLGWENPLGTGLNRNAFFDGLDRKYQMNGAIRGGHSHSGVVDFFIANGLPGLLLWFAFLLSLVVLGWRTFAGANMALGLMLIFLVSGFFSRSLVDSNIRDHVLQQFLFMVGLFATLCAAALPMGKGTRR